MTARYRILVVAHDAGGANVLAALGCKYRDAFDWRFAVAGPAWQIVKQARLAGVRLVEGRGAGEIAALLDDEPADILLTGSGWAAELERDGIRAARRCGVPVLTYLDHWVNYRERFAPGEGWRAALPDGVLVGDGYAHEQALRDGFPPGCLAPVENPYLAAFLAHRGGVARPRATGMPLRVLFLSEPVAAAPFVVARPAAELERRVLASMIDGLGRAGAEGTQLSVRLHPSEPHDKYDELLRREQRHEVRRRVEVHAASARDLAEDCADADRVVGIASMALLAAAALGRPSYSYRVGDGGGFNLPQGGIVAIGSDEALAQLLCPGTATAPEAGFDARLFSTPFPSVIRSHLACRHEPCR